MRLARYVASEFDLSDREVAWQRRVHGKTESDHPVRGGGDGAAARAASIDLDQPDRRRTAPAIRRRLGKNTRDAAVTLHETAEGKQILLFFHFDKIVPFEPSYLESIRALVKKHKELKSKPVQAQE